MSPHAPTRRSRKRYARRTLLAALALLLAAGAAPRRVLSQQSPQMKRVAVSSDGNDRTFTVVADGTTLRLEMEGEVELGDDLRSVERVPTGARLTVEAERGGTHRSVEYRDTSTGMERAYFVDGARRPFGNEARALTKRVIGQVAQHTSLDDLVQYRNLLEEEGAGGVLEAVASGEVANAEPFLEYLLAERTLGTRQRRRVIRLAGRLPSDEGEDVLIELAAKQPLAPNLQDAWFQAVSALPSSDDQADALITLLENGKLTGELRDRWFQAVRALPSSNDQEDALIAFLENGQLTAETRNEWFEAVRALPSSSDQEDALIALVETGVLADAASREPWFHAVRAVPSSSDQEDLLVAFAKHAPASAPLPDAFFETLRRIPTASDQAEVLRSVLHRDLSQKEAARWLRTTAEIASDDEKTDLLFEAMPQLPESDSVHEAFTAVIDAVNDSNDRERLTRAYRRSQADAQ